MLFGRGGGIFCAYVIKRSALTEIWNSIQICNSLLSIKVHVDVLQMIASTASILKIKSMIILLYSGMLLVI